MVKVAVNIYYCTSKIQVRGLCVGGAMVILFLVRSILKWPYLRLRTTHELIFGTIIDIGSIFYHNKNQVSGLCVGGFSIRPRDLQHTFNKL